MDWYSIKTLPAGRLVLVWFPADGREEATAAVASWEEAGDPRDWYGPWGDWLELFDRQPALWMPLPEIEGLPIASLPEKRTALVRYEHDKIVVAWWEQWDGDDAHRWVDGLGMDIEGPSPTHWFPFPRPPV